ncbi:stage II sporulation protein M [Nanoarchaeota archaeon]
MIKFSSLKQAVKLVKDNKKLIFLMAGILLLMAMYGYFQPDVFKEQQEQLIDSIMTKIEGKNGIEITSFIIFNNVRSAFFSILFGITFFPIVDMVVNGYFIGAVLNSAVAKTSYFIVWRLIPHGIFEIPAIAIAAAFGIRIGLALFKKDRKKNIVNAYKEGFFVLVYVVIPLLMVAGVIEGILFYLLNG